jgi:hypothetical protein
LNPYRRHDSYLNHFDKGEATMDVASAPVEKKIGSMLDDPETLQFHTDKIRVDGYTVVEDVLPLRFIEEMRDRFDVLLEEFQSANPTNRGTNRFQMFLPFEAPFNSPELYENPTILAVVEAVIGSNILWTYLASDTPLPGSDYQRVHSDTQLLFPETNFSAPPYGIVVNFPLVDVNEENGPLEIWPGGTHYMPSRVNMQQLAEQMVSKRLTMKAGSVLIRDLRAWHRGTPNRGTRSRPNIALVYTRPWYRFEQKPPTLRRSELETLSDKAKAMLRHATILEG